MVSSIPTILGSSFSSRCGHSPALSVLNMKNIILMDTLPNVYTRRGGSKSSHVGFTSNVSPEVQSPQAENSHTGVTSDFAPKANHEWFVLRVLYGHTKDVVEAFDKAGVLYYLPMRCQSIEIAGKRKRRNSLLLPGFIFAYMTREKTKEFVKQPSRTAKFLKYYTDKTRPVEAETQLNPPITIADDRMRSFINVVETKNEHIMTAPKERCRFKSGDFFRVVCGDFKGVVGQVVRAAGQQRIAVELKGIGYVLTAYIPSDFMERIED